MHILISRSAKNRPQFRFQCICSDQIEYNKELDYQCLSGPIIKHTIEIFIIRLGVYKHESN